ncbi:MAG: hypothetical protein JO137_19805 [Hyphomicrobiales bacterium]|nr:hypothetical protein [Hyphomicrobiales bacterium]
MDVAASEDAADSGDCARGMVGADAGNSAGGKAARTDAGGSETASLGELGFRALEVSGAKEDDVGASEVGVSVVAGDAEGGDTDGSGIARPATTGAVDAKTASPFKPVPGSIDFSGSESEAALSPASNGEAVGITVFAKAVAGISETAPSEPELEAFGSVIRDAITASGVGEVAASGRVREACGIV